MTDTSDAVEPDPAGYNPGAAEDPETNPTMPTPEEDAPAEEEVVEEVVVPDPPLIDPLA
jgi:hypothetical protein